MVVEQCTTALREAGRFDEHQVALSLVPLVVEGDPTRLEQVVANLLDNAQKYTPAGGRIDVTVGQDGQEAVLRVRDTGIGIPSEVLPRVFDVFTQASRSLERSKGGLGLGLTLVKRLVELHGGTVSAASAGPGKGSEFVVRLPIVGVSGPPPSTPRAPRPIAPRTVVLVEDHADVRAGLRTVLELWGHRVEDAPDGIRGLELILTRRPDIALIDVGLPGLDGYGIAQAVRAAPAGNRVYLVALTGYGQPEDRQRSLDAGFDDHVVKPVAPAALRRVLSDAAPDATPPTLQSDAI